MVKSSGESTSLFDDYEFLIILLALFAVLVGGGLLWEYFYYKPKMERLNKVNGESTLDTINFGFLFCRSKWGRPALDNDKEFSF